MIDEPSIIIESLDLKYPGRVRMLPDDSQTALKARFVGRYFDNYLITAMHQPVFEALRADGARKDEAMA